MKSLIRITAFALLLLSANATLAQDDLDEFNDIMAESIPDAEKLMEAYADPFMKSLALALNQGWYNTAKPHKIAGVDLTITVNAMKIPTDQNSYEPGKLNLNQIELSPSSPSYPKAPTLVGKEETPIFRLKSNTAATFQGPPGIDLKKQIGRNMIPVPMAHLGFGLPKNTDLKIRFSPEINVGDGGSVKIFGVGIMHDVKQWIPGIKSLPFDLSGFIGITKFTLETPLEATSGQNQRALFTMNATTIQGIISKKISVVTFYGSLGYNIAKSQLAMKGEYDFNGDNDSNDANEVNPITLDFAASGMRMTTGMRLKLAVFTLHADYTVQKYSCLSVGFGISVR
jgi:hypothetical protein